jgi:hypothetical protein
VLDENLIERAKELTGIKTKREVVTPAVVQEAVNGKERFTVEGLKSVVEHRILRGRDNKKRRDSNRVTPLYFHILATSTKKVKQILTDGFSFSSLRSLGSFSR